MKTFLFCLVLFSQTTFALVDFKQDIKNQKTILYTTYEENEKFVAKEFVLEAGKMEEVLAETVFETKKEYQTYLEDKKLQDNELMVQFLGKFAAETEDPTQSVWETKNTWNDQWEERYGQWILANVDADFFNKHNIKVDCADVAYALRWIFARINSLPMIVTKYPTKNKFSNTDFKLSWAKLTRDAQWDKDRVFMASLRYLLGMTSTKTLADDSYQIKKEIPYLGVGTINFLGGHTQVITRFDLKTQTDYPVYTFESTLPAEARILTKQAFVRGTDLRQFGWVENGQLKTPSHRAVQLKKDELNGLSFEEFVKDNNLTIDSDLIINSLVTNLITKFDERIRVVDDGYAACNGKSCDESSALYETHSTPSRDARLFEMYKEAKEISQNLSSIKAPTQDFETIIKNKKVDVGIGEVNIPNYFKFYQYGMISSDPRDEKILRWGTEEEKMILHYLSIIQQSIKNRNANLASPCVTAECTPDSANWKKYNSYLSDVRLKTKLAAIYLLCDLVSGKKTFNCGSNVAEFIKQKIGSDPNQIWHYVSNPNAEIDARNGKLQSANYQAVPVLSKTMKLLNKDYLLLENAILNLKTFKMIPLNHDIEYASAVYQKGSEIFIQMVEAGSFSNIKVVFNVQTETLKDVPIVFDFSERLGDVLFDLEQNGLDVTITAQSYNNGKLIALDQLNITLTGTDESVSFQEGVGYLINKTVGNYSYPASLIEYEQGKLKEIILEDISSFLVKNPPEMSPSAQLTRYAMRVYYSYGPSFDLQLFDFDPKTGNLLGTYLKKKKTGAFTQIVSDYLFLEINENAFSDLLNFSNSKLYVLDSNLKVQRTFNSSFWVTTTKNGFLVQTSTGYKLIDGVDVKDFPSTTLVDYNCMQINVKYMECMNKTSVKAMVDGQQSKVQVKLYDLDSDRFVKTVTSGMRATSGFFMDPSMVSGSQKIRLQVLENIHGTDNAWAYDFVQVKAGKLEYLFSNIEQYGSEFIDDEGSRYGDIELHYKKFGVVTVLYLDK